MMRVLTRWFYYGYTWMLLGVGGSGILIAPWELTHVFAVDLAGMGPGPAATLLNQYRFLKSTEFAFGLYCWLFRHATLAGGQARSLFLAGLFTGVAARVVSLLVDGMPHWAFLLFALLEFICGALVLAGGSRRWRPT